MSNTTSIRDFLPNSEPFCDGRMLAACAAGGAVAIGGTARPHAPLAPRGHETLSEFAARAKSVWAWLLRKIYEADPLECPVLAESSVRPQRRTPPHADVVPSERVDVLWLRSLGLFEVRQFALQQFQHRSRVSDRDGLMDVVN